MLLGLDVGTSSIKALLMDGRGNPCGRAAIGTPFHGTEMAVPDLVDALRHVIALLGEARTRVTSVAIAGMAESGAPLDRRGVPMAGVIAWHDRRGAEVVDRILARLGPGLETQLGQRLRTVSSVAKLGWLIDHGVGPVERWLGVPELVLLALTGVVATEHSLAARSGAYHVGERRYLPEVVAALGAPPGVFAEVGTAGSVLGTISPPGAAWSGLPQAIPVTLAGHDHLAGVVGTGAGPEDLGNSVGTAEIVVARDQPRPDGAVIERALSQRVSVTVMPGGRRWGLMASAARSGIVLTAVAAALGCSLPALDEAAREHRRDGGAVVDGLIDAAALGCSLPELDEAAREHRQGGGALAVDELIDAAVRGEAIVLPPASPGAIWNGLLFALAGRTWDAADRLGQVVGPSVGARGMVVFGGGSRSRPWLEAKAAARPERMLSRSPTDEAVARGAALQAGVAAGWWASPDEGPPLELERVPANR